MKHKTAFITSIILTGGILAAIASSIAWFDHKTTLTPAILQGSTQGAILAVETEPKTLLTSSKINATFITWHGFSI